MRKKIYVLAVAAVIAGTMLTACGSKNEAAQTTEAEITTEAAAEETVEGTTAESASEETEAGGTEAAADEMLDKAHEAVKSAYGENYIPSMPYDAAALKEVFGLDPASYESFIAEGPMISVQVDTFIGVKAKSGETEAVVDALKSYREKQLTEAMQYPMNMVRFESAEITVHGDYVFFVMLGAPDPAAEEKGEDAALESAKANNRIGVDAIAAVFDN